MHVMKPNGVRIVHACTSLESIKCGITSHRSFVQPSFSGLKAIILLTNVDRSCQTNELTRV